MKNRIERDIVNNIIQYNLKNNQSIYERIHSKVISTIEGKVNRTRA